MMLPHRAPRGRVSLPVFRSIVITAVLAALAGLVATAQTQVTSQDSPLFLPTIVYPSGANATIAVALADLNRDGKLDAIVLDTCGQGYCGGYVGVLLGKGDGSFLPTVNYDTASAMPRGIAIADVNGDGKLDVVVAHNCRPPYCSGDVSVLLGNGDGTFRPAVTYVSGGEFDLSIAVGDVNGDKKPDLVVAVCADDNCNGGFAVLSGKGDGTFEAGTVHSSGGLGAQAVAVADLNADGKADVLVANNCGTLGNCYEGSVAVLLGVGDGTFRSPILYPSGGSTPVSLATADLNGDGKVDVVVANSDNLTFHQGAVGVLRGNGNGTLQYRLAYPTGGVPDYYHTSVAIADFNGDGKLDLAVAAGCEQLNCTSTQSLVSVLLGSGDGTFQTAQTFNSGGYMAAWTAVGDLNGDSNPDIVVANPCGTPCEFFTWAPGSLGVLLNNSRPRTPTSLALASCRNPALLGEIVTFTAKVTSSAGAPPDGEIVTFYNGTTILGTAFTSAGSAALTTTALPAGILSIKATYPGDSTFGGSSAQVTQVVNTTAKSATATTLASSLNPSVYGQTVTFTARVTTSGSFPPTGTVNFKWGTPYVTHNIGTVALNASGTATLVKFSLNADQYNLVAVYSGDTNNLQSTSAVVNQTVLQTTSTATLTASPNPATYGQPVTFTGKITSPTVTPSGPVTFTAGTVVLGTAQLVAGGATFTTFSLQPGSTTIKISYSGNSNIAKSSASLTEVVP